MDANSGRTLGTREGNEVGPYEGSKVGEFVGEIDVGIVEDHTVGETEGSDGSKDGWILGITDGV